MSELTIRLRTLTPLWTGGVVTLVDRLHETGVLGGLRWWYEAIVRGVDGYACDPTSEDAWERCSFDTEAYARTLAQTGDVEQAVKAGIQGKVCAACYLFGCTGWRRRFRLEMVDGPKVPLHLRSTIAANASWFDLILAGKEKRYKVKDHRVFYWPDYRPALRLRMEGYGAEYALSQLAMLLGFVESHAGLGAKLQHGFGQVSLQLPQSLAETGWEGGLANLHKALKSLPFRQGKNRPQAPSLKRFFWLEYELEPEVLEVFIKASHRRGRDTLGDERPPYIPVAFDLRYKGQWEDKMVGLRRWLEWQQKWPQPTVDAVMGPSPKGGRKLTDEERQSSRVFFSMPLLDGEVYRLRIFGFVPPGEKIPSGELTVLKMVEECKAYMRQLFDAEPVREVIGRELLGGGR